ncbi:hypothetical protein [Micromonospora tulbaghiae]|uniref:hypothetical protein n=1 Tax=Micromonospora tulbaghiae TaxID=479978 RepID=UPI0013C488E0|nr:hypothetical protein [Micromonospora tulbaghiae]
MITLILAYLAAALLLTTAGLALALHRSDRHILSLSHRCARQAARIRSHRSEAQLLGEACDRLAKRNEELRDDLDVLTRPGAAQASVAMTAWLGTLGATHNREYPR